jgi:DNA-binding transcriptional ArsR family regulator
MESSGILTFSAPQTEVTPVAAIASPTLELAYAYYFLNRPDSKARATELPWLEHLYGKHPELFEHITHFWKEAGSKNDGFNLFTLVSELGYAKDANPNRFFADFDGLPDKAIKVLRANRKKMKAETKDSHSEKDLKMYEDLVSQFEALREPGLRSSYQALLKQLWVVLEPLWKKEGHAQAERASQAFLAKYEETGSVLEALPTHHFTQFESSAQHIRKSLEKGRVVVVPLYFAAGGGFNFDFTSGHYIGYGIQSERHHEKLAARVEATASRIKAVADPTRLMLLTLIARYKGFDMTVSDFAAQLGVSQPTVSGHLKLLKEADLVGLEKKGNKSIYRVNSAAIKESLSEFEALVLGVDT